MPNSIIFPHARFGTIQRWSGGTDDAFASAHYSDIDGGTITSHPAAISVQMYALMGKMEIDVGSTWGGSAWSASADDTLSSVMCRDYSATYATAHSDSVENYWLHAKAGVPNYVMNIASVTSGGVVTLSDLGHGGAKSFPYAAGQSIVFAGTAAGAGTYTLASVQQNGFTVTGWSAGALGAGGTVSITGTGASTLANRMTVFFWSEWRHIPNYGNANCQAMHVARFVGMMQSGVRNAVLIDELDDSNITTQHVENSLEYTATLTAQWVTDLCTTATAILATSGSGGPKYLRANTAAYHNAIDIQIANAFKGIHDEADLYLFNYAAIDPVNYVVARAAAGVDVEYVNGGTWSISGGVGTFQGLPGSYTVGNYPTATARAQMALYCLYLMAVDASYTALDGSTQKRVIMYTNGAAVGQGPLSAMWQVGFEYNIGQPTAGFTNVLRTDPAGFAIRTLSRTFSLDGGATASAFVVFNGNVNGQSNYGENSLVTTTLPTPPVGKSWYFLNADGTTSAATFTSVNSRRSEGVIFVALASPGTLPALAQDSLDRVNSSSSLGTADVGGAWTAQSGTWGITSNAGYTVSGTNGGIATLTLSTTPEDVGTTIVTDAIDTHVHGLLPLYVDANNYLVITYFGGSLVITTVVGGASNARNTVTGITGLPASGVASFLARVTVNPATSVVTAYINGLVAATYTLVAGELAAFGAATKTGLFFSWTSGTATAATFNDYYANPTIAGGGGSPPGTGSGGGTSSGLVSRTSSMGGARGAIIKAAHRLNPCLDMEADIVAVEAAAVASTSDDWSKPLGSGGLMTSSSNIDPSDAQGVLRIARIPTPTPIFSNTLTSTIKHDFSDSGRTDGLYGVQAKPSMELFLDFWPDPAIFTAPISLNSLKVQLGRDGNGTITYGGTFIVTFYQFDRQWRRQSMGPPVQVATATSFGSTGVTTFTFDFSKRNFIFEPGRVLGGGVQSGPGRTSAGALRTANLDPVTGISYLLVNKGFSLGIRATDVGGLSAYLLATDNASLANFDPSTFWRAETSGERTFPGDRTHGPYDPGARRYSPLNIQANTDGFLLTGAVPGYGAKSVTNGYMGYAKAVRQFNAARPTITQPWAVPYHALAIDTYWNTGTEVIVLDLGKVPTQTVEVRADDVITGNSSVTYGLKGSNASNAGPWTTIGTVVDGQLLTGANLYQFYQVTITLTATGGGAAPSVLGSDAFGRADSSSSMGTADVGGAWTARAGTVGLSSGRGYFATDAGGGNLATLTLASTPAVVQVDVATTNIHYYAGGPLLLYADTSNWMRLTFLNGTALLETKVAGTVSTRRSVATTLPATGAASWTAKATIASNVVTLFVNSVQVGLPYTLTAGEISAFGSAVMTGLAGNTAGTVGTNCTFDNWSATTGGAGGGVAYATPQVNAFTLTARIKYATTRYDQDLDVSSTIDPITGDAGVGALTLSLLKLTRDQRDLATFLASHYSPASIEAQIYAVNRISGARWYVNSYRLEGRVPSDLDESFSFVSGLDRLMVNVPPESPTAPGGALTVSAVSVSGSDVQLTFAGSPALPTAQPNDLGSTLNYSGVQGYRLYVLSPTSTVAGRNFGIIATRSTTANSCWITPFTTSVGDSPAVGDVVEIHSDVTHRVDKPYVNLDYATIYADVLVWQAQVPSRYRGTMPALTNRATSTQVALAPRLQGNSPRTALDVLKELALHCGGCLSWDQGRINFVPIFSDAEPVAYWDEREYVTLETPQGADRRMPRIVSKYNYDWNAGAFQNESHFTDLDAFFGFGLANLYDVTTLADSLCAWSDAGEAQFLANQFLKACSTGVRIWKVSLVKAWPWIQFGDAVTIATDQYTDHAPRYADGTNDNGVDIFGRTYATGRVIGKNLWGTEFLVFVPGLGAIASSAVTVGTLGGPYDDIPVPLDLTFATEVRGDASVPVSSVLATYTPPDDPYFLRMVYSIQARRTGDTSYGIEQVVTGDRQGIDRISVSPGTDLLITPITMTTANHALSVDARSPVAVVVPAFAPPTPSITAVAGAAVITYNFTLDAATKYMEVWGRTYATGSQPAAAPNQWNASGATRSDTIRSGDGRTFITRAVGVGSEYDSVTFVPFDANNLPGTPISFLTVKAGSNLAPSAPTAASNTSVTSSSVTNTVTMPASITHFDAIRVYKNSALFGSDIPRTAAGSGVQTVVHTGLGALEPDSWQYSGVNSATGDESSKTTSFNTTTSALTIPTPSISASYANGSDTFQINVAPGSGTPAGVTWHLKIATTVGGSYTTDTSAASTSTSLQTDASAVPNHGTRYFKVWGTKTGYTNSADSNSASNTRNHTGAL
jgi:hypothetical protein